MKDEAIRTLTEEGISKEKIEYYPSLDLRYIGQFHEVPLEVSMKDITALNAVSIKEAFHKEHNRKYGYELKNEGTELEIINVRLRAVGVTEKPQSLSGIKIKGAESLEQALKGRRPAYIPETDSMQEVPVYNGDILFNNFKIEGPALIEQINTTIFIGASYNCETGIGGCFVVYNKFLMPNGLKKINILQNGII
ncbi:MAG: hypothetical protein COZ59_06000 [Bacteroidetes bacterium CG_4_8_14_3_um_filter_31_14]|nr:MAG: hypothetical protein COZ59_06000 [Bacteroidetes bacterium CG_4_8_14_3_um_filter_31_14]